MTRSPWAVLALALLDGAIGAAVLAEALSHGRHRDVLVHFFVYGAIIFLFKARDAARRVPALIKQARTNTKLLLGPWWLQTARLLIGYDSWSRTERLGIIVVSVIVTTLFGWAKGGPFAAALFVAVALVNAVLALIALGARLSTSRG
ncbi:MAG TPA: hypothetical protein VIL77_17070 [Gaiellaceae bacterium]